MFVCCLVGGDHFDLIDVQAAVHHRTGDLHMVAFMAFDGVLVMDSDDFLLVVGDQDGLGAAPDAGLGARFALGVRALGAAFVVHYPAGHGVVGGPCCHCEQ